MGKPLGFKDFNRQTPKKLIANDRIKNWKEIYLNWPKTDIQDQGARCMDCGVPFCHTGCPLGNKIPEFNDLVYKMNGKKLLKYYILQIISLNSPEEFALLHARPHVC